MRYRVKAWKIGGFRHCIELQYNNFKIRDAEVAGSNPVASTKALFYKGLRESSRIEKSLKIT